MGAYNKHITGYVRREPKAIVEQNNYDKMHPRWDFSNVDRDGEFAFDISRSDFDTDCVFDKLIQYSSKTWYEIKTETHDSKNKTKNHTLNYDKISKDGKSRIKFKQIPDEDLDIIFSFALTNLIRIIGLKKKDVFHVIWYDCNHRFCPSNKDGKIKR